MAPRVFPAATHRLLRKSGRARDPGCRDPLSPRRFIGYGIDETRPDDPTISRTRRLFWLSTHRAVFTWLLKVLVQEGLLGQTVCVDATTVEANATVRSIVCRSDGPFEGQKDLLKGPIIVLSLPYAAGLWVGAVHHQVHVGMLRVVVRNHQHLVLSKPEFANNAVGNGNHGSAAHLVPR